MSKDLTVSIVTYKSRDCILECLESFIAHSGGLDMEIVVVDNNSRDDAMANVKRLYPQVTVIENDSNLGFAGGNNLVLSNFDSRYCLVSNPDILVMPDTLREMIRFMDDNADAGICGCRILNPDMSLQYSCRRYPTPLMVLTRGLLLDRLPPAKALVKKYLMVDRSHDRVMPVDWLTGCCLLIRKETVKDVGLMDENYFLYFEDVDLCYRVNRRWKVFYLPSVSMIHEFQHTSRTSVNLGHKYHHMRSALRFFIKKRLLEKGKCNGTLHSKSTQV